MRSNRYDGDDDDDGDLTSCPWANLLAFINAAPQAYTLETPNVAEVAVTTKMGHHQTL